jgi:hypothetical protein
MGYLSLLDEQWLNVNRILTFAQVADSYLLALAAAHGGCLATLDRRLTTSTVRNGAAALHVISLLARMIEGPMIHR